MKIELLSNIIMENNSFQIQENLENPSVFEDSNEIDLELLCESQNISNRKARESLNNLQKLDLDVKEAMTTMANEENFHYRESFGVNFSHDQETEKLIEDLQKNILRRNELKKQLKAVKEVHQDEVRN